MNAAFGLRALVFFVVFVLVAVFDFFELLAMSSPVSCFTRRPQVTTKRGDEGAVRPSQHQATQRDRSKPHRSSPDPAHPTLHRHESWPGTPAPALVLTPIFTGHAAHQSLRNT